MTRRLARVILVVIVALTASAVGAPADEGAWTPAERRLLRSLWIGSLPPVPDDPSNAYDTDPRAAALGRRLFFDPSFSADGRLACATCHPAASSFQDRKPVAEGRGRLRRRSMPLLGVGYHTWFFWDGRKDSLWSQAATPIENTIEHGLTRADVARWIERHARAEYVAIFGAFPEEPCSEDATTRVFVHAAKALAAFVRTIVPGPARFDRWVARELGEQPPAVGAPAPDADATLTATELRGLRLFIGRAGCASCHAGPLFTNGEFHFTRVPQSEPDDGRSAALALVRGDELNCLGAWSDAAPDACGALRFLASDTRDTQRAFKTPTLRNVAVRAPYMHAGQFATLRDVLRFYRDRSTGLKALAHGDLADADLDDLEAFLGTLTGPVHAFGDAPAALR